MNAHSRQARLDGTALLTLLTCCLLWGLNQVAVKVALIQVGPLTQLALRCATAGLLLVMFASWRGVALWSRDGSWRPGLLAGSLFGLEFLCIFVGLQFTTASRMTVFIYLAPFVVALCMPLVNEAERLSARQWLGLGIAFCGVAVTFSEGFWAGGQVSGRQWLGDGLGVCAAILWGATTVVIRGSRLAQAAPEKTLGYQLGVTTLLATAAALMASRWGHPLLHEHPSSWSGLTWSSLAFQGVIVTFASYLAWFWLVRQYPATQLAAFTLLTPVAGLMMGVWLLQEPLTLPLLFGLATVVAGLWLIQHPGVSARRS